jgi:DNA-binding XRE family transcriptional regulator
VKNIKGSKNKDLYELKIKFSSYISRIFYFSYEQNTFILLHGFVKKSNKTPERELERARKYKIDYESRCDMSKASVKLDIIKEKLMKNEEFKDEYKKLKPRYEIISQIIETRNEQHITQEELALRVGTKRSNISRLESGTYNPSLDFLIKVAKGLGKNINIQIK